MKNLKTFRESANLTQQQLADKSGVHIQTVFKIENGRTDPGPEIRKSLEIALQSRVNWLATCRTDKGEQKTWENLEADLREVLINAKNLEGTERRQFIAVLREYTETIDSLITLEEEEQDNRFLLPLDVRMQLRDRAEGIQ